MLKIHFHITLFSTPNSPDNFFPSEFPKTIMSELFYKPNTTNLKFLHTHHETMVQQLIVNQGLLIIETSRSHSDTPHTVGFL
jgi:hypothetical protein